MVSVFKKSILFGVNERVIIQSYGTNSIQHPNLLGHTLVPKQYKSDQSLSSWVFRQRRQYSFLMNGEASSLSTDRLEKLKQVCTSYICFC
jgi:hypothetical protein